MSQESILTFFKQKKGIAALVLVLVLIVGFFLFSRQGSSTEQPEKKLSTPTEAPIPTVGPEVQVTVEKGKGKSEFDLSIEGIPQGTESFEYVITYETTDGGLPGISSSIELEPGESSYTKEGILLGTCSTGGACVYHELVGPLQIAIKFIGPYGAQLFEGAFEL